MAITKRFDVKFKNHKVRVKYDMDKRFVSMTAASPELASEYLTLLMCAKKVGAVDTIAYKALETSNVIAMMRGKEVMNFLKANSIDPTVEKPNKTFVDILEAHEEEEKRVMSSIVVYCVNSDRFLFHKGSETKMAYLWTTDIKENEAPLGAAVRQLSNELGLRVSPDSLVPLWIREDKNMVYSHYLLVVRNEFSPADKSPGSYIWLRHDDFNTMDMYPIIGELFENEPLLGELVAPKKKGKINFSELVDDIIH